MIRLLAAVVALLLLTSPGEAQVWSQPTLAPSTVYQPYLAGDQAVAPGMPGAAVSVSPRPMTLSARIFRSYSGIWCGLGKCISMGGGHAGHPGNDIDVYDIRTNTWTLPFQTETPPPYLQTTLAVAYAAGATTVTPATVRGFEVGQRAWLENATKTTLRVTAITVLTRTPHPDNLPLTGTLTVTVEANPGAAPVGTIVRMANRDWRGIKGGAVGTSAVSETNRPLVHHTYDLADWDTKRNRLLFAAGSGFGTYSLDGTWTRLAGKHLTDPVTNPSTGVVTNVPTFNVTMGSGGTVVYDEGTDSAFLFASDSMNGAARGVYQYKFNPDGTIATKKFLHGWPTLPNWSFATKTIMATRGPGRTAYLVLRPTTETTNTPRNRLFTYNLDNPTPASVVWDQTLTPGNPAYDQVNFDRWARRAKTGELYFPVVQADDHDAGFWIKSEATNAWTFKAVPGAPDIVRWTFSYDALTDTFIGFKVNNIYCGTGSACGGPAMPWILTFGDTPPPPVATIDVFTATPPTSSVGKPVTLTWATTNASTVTLNGLAVAVDGSQTVTPLVTTQYDLLADGVSRRLTVTVTEDPLEFTIDGKKYRLQVVP